MSNLLVVHGSRESLAELIDRLDPERNYSEDWRIIDLAGGACLLDARRGVDRTLPEDAFIFEGFAVDHQGGSLAIGTAGFRAWREERLTGPSTPCALLEGAYALVEWNAEVLRVQHDVFGLQPLCWSHANGCNILTDSMWVMRTVRRALGAANRLEMDIVRPRLWGHGLAAAALSDRTVLSEVHLLPPGGVLHADVDHPEEGFNLQQMPLRECFPRRPGTYAERLESSAREIRRLLHTLGGMEGLTLDFGLSGGLDSRVVLALLRSCPGLMERVHVRTNPHATRRTDQIISQRVAAQCGFDLNTAGGAPRPEGAVMETVANPLGDWILSDLGLFDMMYIRATHLRHPQRLALGGHGAEIVKGTFLKPASEFTVKAPMRFRELLELETTATLSRLGIDASDEDSLQWFHMALKSGIQNGRFITHDRFGLRPLMHAGLFALAADRSSAEDTSRSLLHDLLILLDPDLASLPFDKVAKNVRPTAVATRHAELNQVLFESALDPYDVHGSLLDLHNAPCGLFRSWVEHITLGDEGRAQAMRGMLQERHARIENAELAALMEEVRIQGDEALGGSDPYLPLGGKWLAKMLLLDLAD